MHTENRHNKRVMALMPDEEPVFVRAQNAQYSAKLVNISSGGALISVLDRDLASDGAERCSLFFTSSDDSMFGVKGEMIRTSGRYAAFRFVELTKEKIDLVDSKIYRMDHLMHEQSHEGFHRRYRRDGSGPIRS